MFVQKQATSSQSAKDSNHGNGEVVVRVPFGSVRLAHTEGDRKKWWNGSSRSSQQQQRDGLYPWVNGPRPPFLNLSPGQRMYVLPSHTAAAASFHPPTNALSRSSFWSDVRSFCRLSICKGVKTRTDINTYVDA